MALKVRYEYGDRKFLLVPYTTSQEKDLLLLSAIGDADLDLALDICNAPLEGITLTKTEKIAMLYKFREISVGSEISLKFKCSKCSAQNENTIDIEGIVTGGKNHNDFYDIVTEDNIVKFLEDDTNTYDMNIDDFEVLVNRVKKESTQFNFKRVTICQKCTAKNYISTNAPEFVIDVLSEDSLVSIYQTYNDLIFFGSYSKIDIDTFYPFERTILIGLLNKSREDLNK